MNVTPPPLPRIQTPYREINSVPLLGDELGLFKVVDCSPDSLRLSVHAGRMIVTGFASIAVAVVAFIIFWFTPTTIHTVTSEVGGTSLTVAIIAGLLGPVLLANIGHSMEIDRIKHRVRVTWLYLRTREYPADRFKAVVIEIQKPTPSAVDTTKATATAAPQPMKTRYANSAACFLEGSDEQGQPLRLKVADCALSLKNDWPALASAAIHLTRVLRLPLRFEGAVDQLSPIGAEQMATIVKLSHRV